MKRELPVLCIYDKRATRMLVDVEKLELRQKDFQDYIVRFEDMQDLGTCYRFEFNPYIRDGAGGYRQAGDYVQVTIPALVTLDPKGMGEKYGFSPGELAAKSDFEVMVDQGAFRQRVENGRQPRVTIEGHTFFVEVRTGKLNPKDDFWSRGIVFDEIRDYYDNDRKAYVIPYNPKTHEFQPLDRGSTAIPKDLVAISFPHERMLDPVGFNRQDEMPLTYGLKWVNLKLDFEARRLDWKDTALPEIIRNKQRKRSLLEPGHQERRKRGPRL